MAPSAHRALLPKATPRTIVSRVIRPRSGALGDLLQSIRWGFFLQLAGKTSALISIALIARMLSPDQLGNFASLQALALIAASLTDLGVSGMIARDVAAEELDSDAALAIGIRMRLLLFPLALLPFGLVALFGRSGISTSAGLLFPALALTMSTSLMLSSLLRGRLEFRAASTATATGYIILIALLGLLLLAQISVSLDMLAVALLCGEIAATLLLARQCRQVGIRYRPRYSGRLRDSFSRSWPFAANGFMGLVYGRSEVVLVALWAGATQAGLYTPATRLQDGLMLFPAVASAGVVQVVARYHGRGEQTAAANALRFSQILSVGLALPAAAAAFILMPWLIPLALGQGYDAAVTPARILVWAVPIAAITAPLLSLLIARGHAKLSSVVFLCTLIASVLFLAILTPRFGASGAALASLLREPVALVVTLAGVAKTGVLRTHPTPE